MKIYTTRLVGILFLTILLISCGGEDARKAKYYEKGKTYFEQGDYDKAKIELKNVLQIDPKFADAYYLFGQVEEKNKNYREAYANYSKTVELDDLNLDAHNKLARFHLLSGDIDGTQEQLNKIISINPKSEHVKMLELLIAARKGDIDKAISIANLLIKEDENQVEAIFILSNMYMRNDDFDNALATLNSGIKNNPKAIALRLQLGGLYTMKKDYSNAERILTEIIALNPNDFNYTKRLIKFYINQKEYDKAEATLRKAVKLDEKDETRKLMLVEFLAKYKSIKDAEEELLTTIQDYPDALNLKFVQAKLYEKIRPEQVESIYQSIIDSNGTNREGLMARNFLAEIALKKKNYKKANKYISEVLESNPRDSRALLVKGKIAIIKKDPVSAVSAFRSVVKEQPDKVEASQLLAMAHMLNKEPELAKDVLIQSIESAPKNPKAYLNYAQYLILHEKYSNANIEIDKALNASPGNLDALQEKLKVASMLHDKDMITNTIVIIKKSHPDNEIGYLKSGDFNLALKNYGDAIIDYEKAFKISGKMLPALASIIKTNLLEKDYMSAIKRLKNIIKEQPENPIPLELLGEVYLAKKNYSKAEKYIKEAISLNKKWPLPYISLATVYIAKKDMSSAIATYKSALQIFSNDTSIYTRLAQLYERSKKFDDAIKVYENILQIKPEHALASNNLAAILSDIRGDKESLQRAKELALKFENSNQPGFLDTLGWVYYKTGEYKKAIELLSKVVDKQPQIALFQYHLGMAYYKSGDKENAKIHLNKAVEKEQKFKERDEAEAILKQL